MSSYYGAAWEAYGVEHWESEEPSWTSSGGKSEFSDGRTPGSFSSDRQHHGRASGGGAESFDIASQDASSDASWWQGDSWHKGPPMGVVRIGSTLARLKMRPGRSQILGTTGTALGPVRMREIVVRDLVMVLEFEIA